MSAPSQFGPQPPSSSGPSTFLIVVLVILGVLALGCCGLCGGCMFLAQKAGDVAQKVVKEGINYALLEPAHLTALQAVLADERVQERLGEPIETKQDSIALYRRSRSGELDPGGETIQFDIKGPKDTAIVSVVATQEESESKAYRVSKITVTFADGSVLDVEPPKVQFDIPTERPGKDAADDNK